MTVGYNRDLGSLLEWGKKQLKKSGIEDFNISAEALLGHILKISRSELLLNPKRTINRNIEVEYERLIAERIKRVPLQYLVGHVEFYNVTIKCDRRALIPRPETEILVDIVLEKLKNLKTPAILDIGTGSGNIAVALAKNIPDTSITGMDISEDALELARENAAFNNVQHRIEFITGDILEKKFGKDPGLYDCIVSNPPYVAEFEKEKLQPEVTEFEPPEALFCAGDPLIFFRNITEIAPRMLKTGGLLAYEVGLGQAARVQEIMSAGFSEVRSYEDLNRIERVVTGIMKNSSVRKKS